MAKDEMSKLEGELKKAVPKRHALTAMGGGPRQDAGTGRGRKGKNASGKKKAKKSGY